MKSLLIAAAVLLSATTGACQSSKNRTGNRAICTGNPRSEVPASLRGNWMYGNFSMTEYWSQNPSSYLGNALQYAIAFKFNADGTYEQYFTSSAVMGGVVTYQQSVTKGTVVVDAANGTIQTYPCSSHYKRTKGGRTVEERDMQRSEMAALTSYTFTAGAEANGTKAVYLTLQGTSSPLTFLQKF